MYDLSALKLAQPNPWLENCKFPQIGIEANAHYGRICMIDVNHPFSERDQQTSPLRFNLTLFSPVPGKYFVFYTHC